MEYVNGVIINRYKRFLVDVRLENGSIVTAHCPNSGRMTGCIGPNWDAILSLDTRNKKRKYPYTLEMTSHGSGWIGVHTGRTNEIVANGLLKGQIPELSGYDEVRREVAVGNSRIDILLSKGGGDFCYVEVKSVTLVEDGVYRFPDAVTLRGRKHLLELIRLRQSGLRAVNFFLIQRSDGHIFEPAFAIDPLYTATMKMAMESGVEFLAYGTRIQPGHIELDGPVPIRITPS